MWIAVWPSICVAACCLAGCGPKLGANRVAVSGTVTYQGAPVAGADVAFQPVAGSAGNTTQTRTDEDGRFRMFSRTEDGEFAEGLTAGEYTITVRKFDRKQLTSTQVPPQDLLPVKYGNQETSGLRERVEVGPPVELTIDLQD